MTNFSRFFPVNSVVAKRLEFLPQLVNYGSDVLQLLISSIEFRSPSI